ncbi:hypothetical protein TNCV_2850411 [Trichonephila clavipes]|nr:hypothetical protein TNCV_2850411 [Trichonephila clavipes]
MDDRRCVCENRQETIDQLTTHMNQITTNSGSSTGIQQTLQLMASQQTANHCIYSDCFWSMKAGIYVLVLQLDIY